MSERDHIASIALTLVPGVGPVMARKLLEHFPDAEDIFHAPTRKLTQVEKVGTVLADAIKVGKGLLEEAARLHGICQSKNIEVLTVLDSRYPARIKEIDDAPAVLYTIGEAEREPVRAVSIVGTRKNTAYGKRITLEIVEGLKEAGVAVVSGLAFGIDTHAHQASLANGITTYAVLPTPLDHVYPTQNRNLAIEIFKHGRLYSEYAPTMKVDVRNFPMRNRLIAALSQATVVVESGDTGGALITARMAVEYNREVFAVPGRVGDEASTGCLGLIAKGEAAVFTGVAEFLQAMDWSDTTTGTTATKRKIRPALPEHLTSQEKELALALKQPSGVHIDDLSFSTGIGLNILSGLLLKLEFDGLVTTMPGKKFRMVDAFL